MLRNPGVRPGSYWVSARAVSWVWGCRPPSLIVLSSVSRLLFQEPCVLGGHLAGSFPPILHPSRPIFKPYFRLYFPHKANETKEKKRYNAIGPPPPPLSAPLSPPLRFVPVPSSPVTFGPPAPLPSSPLSPTPAFFPSLHAAPPRLSPLLVFGVVSPRLPFPSTIWTLIPPLLTTSTQVFLAEGVFVRGWWVFLPLPPVFVVGCCSRLSQPICCRPCRSSSSSALPSPPQSSSHPSSPGQWWRGRWVELCPEQHCCQEGGRSSLRSR
jgi:hypothetical protein